MGEASAAPRGPGWSSEVPTNAPYREIDLQIPSAGVTLPGHLVRPRDGGAVPAIVLMGGSGSWSPYFDYFRALVTAFVPRGIAVLYYEKRGEGTELAEKSSFPALAGDVIAAVHLLQKREDIVANKICVWGHSQGGWIASLAASQSRDIACVVSVSGPGVGPFEQMMYFKRNLDRRQGLSEQELARADHLRRLLTSYYAHPTQRLNDEAQSALDAARKEAWFQRVEFQALQGVRDRLPTPERIRELNREYPQLLQFYREQVPYDPLPALQRIRVPLLAIFGGADIAVPVERSIKAYRAAFRQSQNGDLAVRVFPGANHAILMGDFERLEFAPGYLDEMTRWLTRRLVPST